MKMGGRERIVKESESEEAINSIKEDRRMERWELFNWECLRFRTGCDTPLFLHWNRKKRELKDR